MFIAPRDVSDKIDGGEGSHGIDNRGRKAPSSKSLSVSMVMAPLTRSILAQKDPPQLRSRRLNITLYLCMIDINTRDPDRYRHPRRGHAASTDTRPEVIAIRAIRRRCTCITAIINPCGNHQ